MVQLLMGHILILTVINVGSVSVTNHQADPPQRWSFRPLRSRDTRGCSPTQSEQPSAPQH